MGVQKAGTSALDMYLRRHPGIAMAASKEVHFFDNENVFKKTRPSYRLLDNEFEHNANGLRGECTPIYIYWEPAMKRIWEYNPQIKIIGILRNPIERAYSHWFMEKSKGKEDLEFGLSVRNEVARCRSALPFQHRIYSYVDRGFYSVQIRRISQYFPSNQVCLVKYEEFRDNQQEVLTGILAFLELEPGLLDYSRIIEGANKYDSMIKKDDRDYLSKIYQNEISEVERMLNWDCTDWRC